MAVSVAVCEIFSVKKWCDLENQVRGRSRSLKMAPFSYDERLSRLHLHNLELRRLLTNLVWCYEILFGIVEMSAAEEFFCVRHMLPN